jgi:antitoxin (DNA-binding transcriptional repressor) of toxin-antitoxin stability system
MAVMTISEARAALPEVLNRVAEGEEITITRHGRPIAVVVRPDIVWHQSGTDVVLGEPAGLGNVLRERARRHGRSLQQEVDSILAEADESPATLPPIQLKMVRT